MSSLGPPADANKSSATDAAKKVVEQNLRLKLFEKFGIRQASHEGSEPRRMREAQPLLEERLARRSSVTDLTENVSCCRGKHPPANRISFARC
jgi:hypothetical protein